MLQTIYIHFFDDIFVVKDPLVDYFSFSIKFDSKSKLETLFEVTYEVIFRIAADSSAEAVCSTLLNLALVNDPYLFGVAHALILNDSTYAIYVLQLYGGGLLIK